MYLEGHNETIQNYNFINEMGVSSESEHSEVHLTHQTGKTQQKLESFDQEAFTGNATVPRKRKAKKQVSLLMGMFK